MQTKFFGSNALGGVFCALVAGLIFVVASCDSGGGGGGESSASSGPSSGSVVKPPDNIGSPNITINEPTFYWVMPSRQDEVSIGVSVNLTGVGGDLPDSITGFDSVLVKLNGKTLNSDNKCIKNGFVCSYNRTFDPYVNVETEFGVTPGAGICGADIPLTIEVYALGKKDTPEVRVSKTLKKDADVGNCRSSSSAAPSSSSAFVSKPLIPITFSSCPESSVDTIGTGCLIREGQGINLAEAKGGVTGASDLSITYATETIRIGANMYSITDEFLSNAETGDCSTRGRARPEDSTGPDYYPCPTANVVTSIDGTQGRKYLVKTNAAKDATDWVPGWYLIQYVTKDLGSSSTGMVIKAWKVN